MRYGTIALALLAGLLWAGTSPLFGTESPVKPVTPNAAPEAVELLKLVYRISGRHTMTGQHNFPNTKDTYTRRSAQSWGKVPAVYGQDWGFAKEGDKDSYLARPDIVAECKRQYGLGSIITICGQTACLGRGGTSPGHRDPEPAARLDLVDDLGRHGRRAKRRRRTQSDPSLSQRSAFLEPQRSRLPQGHRPAPEGFRPAAITPSAIILRLCAEVTARTIADCLS